MKSRFAILALLVLAIACAQAPASDVRIMFTDVPSKGSYGNLYGKVTGVESEHYKVAVYIRANGGWWTKPYWNHPAVSINKHGNWTCDITTGGVDDQADAIVAFLVPINYSPPLSCDDWWIHKDVRKHAIAKNVVKRY